LGFSEVGGEFSVVPSYLALASLLKWCFSFPFVISLHVFISLRELIGVESLHISGSLVTHPFPALKSYKNIYIMLYGRSYIYVCIRISNVWKEKRSQQEGVTTATSALMTLRSPFQQKADQLWGQGLGRGDETVKSLSLGVVGPLGLDF
jgi:hypothetical protein